MQGLKLALKGIDLALIYCDNGPRFEKENTALIETITASKSVKFLIESHTFSACYFSDYQQKANEHIFKLLKSVENHDIHWCQLRIDSTMDQSVCHVRFF